MTLFRLNNTELLDSLLSVYPIVPKKPSRDILKCFKITAILGKDGNSDHISIMATDLETFIVVHIDADVVDEGKFVVPAQLFIDYIKALDGGNVEITISSNNTLKINEDLTVFEMSLPDEDEYPRFPDINDNNITYIPISTDDFYKGLSQSVFAVADKGSPRWGSLNAICIDVKDNKLIVIGTDQHRASLIEIVLNQNVLDAQYLVSAKSLAILPKLFTDNLHMSFNSNNLIFTDRNGYFIIRLMHGDYPAVKSFIPRHPHQFSIDPSNFLKQVRKSALAVDKHNTLKIQLEKDKISFYSKSREHHKVAKIEQNIVYSGQEIKFSINCKYLIDLLKASTNDPLVMHFNRNNQPILFTQSNFKHMIVPQETR